MTHRGPFQPLPFCDSVKELNRDTNHQTDEQPHAECLLAHVSSCLGGKKKSSNTAGLSTFRKVEASIKKVRKLFIIS